MKCYELFRKNSQQMNTLKLYKLQYLVVFRTRYSECTQFEKLITLKSYYELFRKNSQQMNTPKSVQNTGAQSCFELGIVSAHMQKPGL